MVNRRKFLAGAAALGVANAMPSVWASDSWPNRPIRIVCPYPPGGIVDIIARLVGEKMSQSLRQPVIIDNRAGAGGNIGTAFVARAKGDPYTLLLGASGPLAINVSLYDDLGYDPAVDFIPLTLLAATPLVLVTSAKSGISSVEQLIDQLRQTDEQPFYGSAGIGTPQHLAGELFKQTVGVDTSHVAYKGGAPAVLALLSGEVLYGFENLALVEPHIRSGALTPLAVTGAARTSVLDNVPTMMESGVEAFEARGWYGLLAPAGVPDPIVERLNAEVVKAARMPDVRAQFASFGSEDVTGTPREFGEYIAIETEKWREIIKVGNVQISG